MTTTLTAAELAAENDRVALRDAQIQAARDQAAEFEKNRTKRDSIKATNSKLGLDALTVAFTAVMDLRNPSTFLKAVVGLGHKAVSFMFNNTGLPTAEQCGEQPAAHHHRSRPASIIATAGPGGPTAGTAP